MFKRILAVLIVLLLTACLFSAAAANDRVGFVSANHFKVVLVVDGSGSLHSQRHTPTDPQDYRYNAVELFLGLMTNAGNYVSAIVFADDPEHLLLNTDLQPISGANAKKELSEKIRAAGIGLDTDIGGALLVAAKKLASFDSHSELEPVIILMSDGVTDFENAKNPQEMLKASEKNRQKAIQICQENGISVHSVLLNKDGQLKSTGELEQISKETGGKYEVIEKAEDLSEIYTLFYSLIYNADIIKYQEISDENGVVVIQQEIPGFGVEEINLIASSDAPVDYILVTSPSGEVRRDVETLKSDVYEFIKIVKPEGGRWKFEIHGHPNAAVKVDVVFNSELGLQLEAKTAFSLESGEPIAAQGFVTDEAGVVTDADAYHAKYLTAELVNAIDPEERYPVDVTVEGTSFQLQTKAPEVKTSQTFRLQAVFSNAGVKASSNALVININPKTVPEQNHPPEAVSGVVDHVVKDSGDGFDYIPLAGLFTDEDGDELKYAIEFSDYSEKELHLDGKNIVIAESALDGSFGLRASDGQAAALVNFRLKGNAPPVAVASAVTETITVNALFGGEKERVFDLSQWFSDADGEELRYHIVACDYDYDKDGTIALSQPDQTLTVKTEGFQKSNLVLRAEDPKGASAELTVHFNLFNWWVVYGPAICIGAAAVILLVCILYKKYNQSFKGHVIINNIRKDGFGGGDSGYRHEHDSFRKRLVLNSLPGVDAGAAGFDGKCTIRPRSKKEIRFRSPKPFYCNNKKVKSVDIKLGSSKDIFSGVDSQSGLRISTESSGWGV